MLAAVYARIQKRLAAKGLKPAVACRKAGLDKDAIRDIERSLDGRAPRRVSVSHRVLKALAPVLGTSVEWLDEGTGPEEVDSPAATVADEDGGGGFRRLPDDVPVRGAAAGSLGEGAFQLTPDVIEYVRRPPSLATARDIYAIYIEGDSMSPEHRPGDLRFVHPRRAPAIGDTVIVHVRLGNGLDDQYYIKHLVRRNGEHVVCSQLNPAATILFKRETVVAIHKVLTMRDLFGI